MNLPSIKRAGSTAPYPKWLKTSFRSATYGEKPHRPIYRDISVLVHYHYSRDSLRHTVLIDEVERAKKPHQIENASPGRTRDRVVKRVFGFAKVRYRGLNKNLHRLLVISALANLFMARRRLLRYQPA